MHGYEIIQELDERANGAWRPSPGSVYPTLSLLEDEGLVTAAEEDGKRRFSLTDAGTDALEANKARRGDRTPWEEIADGIASEDVSLRKLVGQVGVAVKQVAETGNTGAKAKAVEVLTDTRKRLYAILAETD